VQVTCLGAQSAPGRRPGGERAVGSCLSLHAAGFLTPLPLVQSSCPSQGVVGTWEKRRVGRKS